MKVDKPRGVGVGGHVVVKIKITNSKGAAFQEVVVLKEIRKLFRKERVLELLFFPVQRRTVETEDVQ